MENFEKRPLKEVQFGQGEGITSIKFVFDGSVLLAFGSSGQSRYLNIGATPEQTITNPVFAAPPMAAIQESHLMPKFTMESNPTLAPNGDRFIILIGDEGHMKVVKINK